MSKIHIPTPLRQYVGKQASVEVPGSTVGEAMSALVAQHPDLRKHLYTEDGKLRAFVNLYVNDEDIRYLLKEATALQEGDNISIVPSIAGGAGKAIPGAAGNALCCHPERRRGIYVSVCSTPAQCLRSRNPFPSRDSVWLTASESPDSKAGQFRFHPRTLWPPSPRFQ